MTQPTALRLADELIYVSKYEHWNTLAETAAELRRLYDLAMELQGKIYALEMARSMEMKIAALKAQELDRCKTTCDATAESWRESDEKHREAQAAIYRALGTENPDRDAWPEEIRALKLDAERYRYLRNRNPQEIIPVIGPAAGAWIDCDDEDGELILLTGEDADAVIDAERGKE